ncbi:MAG: stage II sporulation protein R, partial [Clostridia bacterium]|nr:stage II sporulation protein R [Clostridia bacterium]
MPKGRFFYEEYEATYRCAAICSLLLFVGLFPVHGEAQIYESVVRLHVLANSDSEEDQSLKLEVRDAVLEYTAPLLSD